MSLRLSFYRAAFRRSKLAAALAVAALGLGLCAMVFNKASAGPPMQCAVLPVDKVNDTPDVRGGDARLLRVFSANVQGLPYGADNLHRKGAPYPANRFDCLSRIASRHDVAVLQEDFTRHPALRSPQLSHVWEPEAGRSRLEGSSGLTFLARLPFTRLASQSYKDCNGGFDIVPYALAKTLGWKIDRLNTKADCFANKSFKAAMIDGVTFITSHLDAGSTPGDVATRGRQFAQLDRATPKAGPLIVAMDANVKHRIAADRESLARYMRNNGLTLALRDDTDVVLVRGVELVRAARIDLTDLSDHAGLSVTLRYKPGPR